VLGLTMQLGLATPLAFMAPHTAPLSAPVPVSTPLQLVPPSGQPLGTPAAVRGGGGGRAVGVPPVASVQGEAPESGGPTPPAPVPITTSTTVYSGFECVVTLSAPDGTTMTYSPGPAINGVCPQGTPEPVSATS
jgi:hypothetical protein